MTAADFRAAIARLGWSQAETARRLGLAGQPYVSRLCRGTRAVPSYVAVSLRAQLRLHEQDDALRAVLTASADPDNPTTLDAELQQRLQSLVHDPQEPTP